ncbi:hypothetical protein PAHAL_5G515100 [Panicum hallii]|uniref:Uncharacterized protein n=1 Tax=Panicum hallii TaxID=206008 RepID=A0A2S3HYT4_9POAL|nr:hypothetical protein PAHAL_5G515100 [Panicum hallii]
MGRWDTSQLVFGVAYPGIRVGTCFYWLCRCRGHSAAARRWSATRRRRRTPRGACGGPWGRPAGASGCARSTSVTRRAPTCSRTTASRAYRRVGDGPRRGVAAHARGGGGRPVGVLLQHAVGHRDGAGLRRRVQ